MTAIAEYVSSTATGPSAARIMTLLLDRKKARSPIVAQMKQVRDVYNSDVVVPLPAIDRLERPAVANVLRIGLDQIGMRVGGVLPDVYFPALNDRSGPSQLKARDRRQAVLAWWQVSKMPLKLRKRARHLTGYGMTAVTMRPDFRRGVPQWHLRDPLSTYPAPWIDPDEINPPDCIYTFTRSWQWLKDNYPDKGLSRLETGARDARGGNECAGDRLFDLVEYVDAECTVLLVQGKSQVSPYGEQFSGTSGYEPWVELERIPNRIGMCPATIGGRINLDRPGGMFDGIVGMYLQQAHLVALETVAVERAIFPDMFLIGDSGMTPRFVSGPHEGRSGKVNIVTNGRLEQVRADPSQSALILGDRLERAQRAEGAVPPEYSGESATNVRTGRRGDAILSATVDHHVHEAQEILAAALEVENRLGIAMTRAFWGREKKSFYVTLGKGKNGHHTYTPDDTFETAEHVVSYPAAGADQNAIVVAAGQRIGLGTMSHKTFMEMDPQIGDPVGEIEQIRREQLGDALIQALQQKVASGEIPPADMTAIMREFDKTLDIAQAVDNANRAAQERQAQATPATAPEAQPGLAAPGMGQEAGAGGGLPSVAPPEPGIQNRADLVRALAAGMPRQGGAA